MGVTFNIYLFAAEKILKLEIVYKNMQEQKFSINRSR